MAEDDDYKGRSGAASYGARKTYRSSPKITNKKQYKDKTTSFVKEGDEKGEDIRDTQAALDAGTLEQKKNLAKRKDKKEETLVKKTKKKKLDQIVDDFFTKKVSGLKFPTLGIPTLGIPTLGMGVIGSLQGFGATDRFFENLQASRQGAGLSSTDLVTLVNLVKRSGENPLAILQNYAEKNDLSENETRDLAAKFNRAYSDLGSKVSSSGIENYFDTKPEGFKDSLSAMFGQYEGDQVPGRTWEIDPEQVVHQPVQTKNEAELNKRLYEEQMKLYEETGNEDYLEEAQAYLTASKMGMVDRPTLEDVIGKLGTEGLEYLRATNPGAYYTLRPPATSGGIADLAGETLVDTADMDRNSQGYKDARDYNNKIFAAREQEGRTRSERQEMGIPSLATAPTPFTDVNNNGILDNLEVAQATTTPVTATTPATATTLGIPSLAPTGLNYASMAPQFGPQYPGYLNQGLMNPNLSPYYDNLRNYYGIG
tara:strand:- start:166 stop:1611 length:1446 start_codon:yes stop_codon:yes gene_type:complete